MTWRHLQTSFHLFLLLRRAYDQVRMGKRTSDAAELPSAKSQTRKGDEPVGTVEEDEGMGEFEDAYEDEEESDEEFIESKDEDGDEVMDVIPAQEDEEGQQVTEAELEAYLKTAKGLEADEHLVPDNSVYLALHQLQYNWPCLSFDILRDGLGWERAKFPHTAYVVAGTQAGEVPGQGKAKDEVVVMRWGSLSRTQKDDLDEEDDEDEDDDDDGDDDDAVLDYLTIPHVGSVNRIRAQPQAPSPALLPPSSDPYHVATFSETGKVHIFDVRPTLDTLASPATSTRPRQNAPVHTITSHGRNEGFALDWAGSSASSNLRLLSGDIASKIYLTTLTPTGFNTGPSPYLSHTSSIEDLQWSPTEPTVFASCSADRSVRVWDVRAKNRKSVVGVMDAHKEDVNVISWNKEVGYLMVSGGDEGELKVWDLRNFKGNGTSPSPVAHFQWHTAPITSVEWHPTDSSVFAASGADDQVTLWDLSVEQDDDEAATGAPSPIDQVPPQLLFVHQGQKDVKELHWHPQIPGMLATTAGDGFNAFKTISV